MILIAIGLLGFLAMRGVYMYINATRRRTISNWTDAELVAEYNSGERRGHQKLTFIYGY